MKIRHPRAIYFVSAAIIGAVLSASLAFSQPPGGGWQDSEVRKERMASRMQAMEERLGLSDAQKELLAAHRANQREAATELRTRLQETRKALKAELTEPELDSAKIDLLQGELKSLHAQKADHRLAGVLEVREILTPDQFSELMALKGKHKRHMKGNCNPDKWSQQ
jgi:Spy/CpxP family protein refolding chaperone